MNFSFNYSANFAAYTSLGMFFSLLIDITHIVIETFVFEFCVSVSLVFMRNFLKVPCKFYLEGEGRCLSLIYLVSLLNDCGWLSIIVINFLCHRTLEANNILCSCYRSCQFMVYLYPLFIAVAFIISW